MSTETDNNVLPFRSPSVPGAPAIANQVFCSKCGKPEFHVVLTRPDCHMGMFCAHCDQRCALIYLGEDLMPPLPPIQPEPAA